MKLKSIVMLLSLVTTMMAFNAAGGSDAEFATTNTATDPIHCDKPGFPPCFGVGYKGGHNVILVIVRAIVQYTKQETEVA
jgi:hypothetical protein